MNKCLTFYWIPISRNLNRKKTTKQPYLLGNEHIKSFYKLQLMTVFAVLTELTRFVLFLVNRYNLSGISVAPGNSTAENIPLETF